MTRANLNEVKSRLAYDARLVEAGETVILCDRNKPFAEIRPLPDSGGARPKREGLTPCASFGSAENTPPHHHHPS